MDLKQHIRSVPDFPKPGILFYDISTLLAHPRAWQTTVQRLAEALRPHQPDLLVGIESRGFLVAAPLAYELGRGFAMVRKRGKLPGGTRASPMISNTGPTPSRSRKCDHPRSTGCRAR
jgi:adenine phosphoribosyltransferase